MHSIIQDIKTKLRSLSNEQIAEHSKRFFKTGRGEYGEGDRFLGIRVPVLRKLVRIFRGVPLEVIAELLMSPYHEERLLALLMLVDMAARGDEAVQEEIYRLYLHNIRFVNNWDLVDCSAEHIIGAYLSQRSKAPLYRLVKSSSLWERRIAIMSCFHFIKQHQFEDALHISKILIRDKQDLIHKAVGWMLREIGKRELEVEERFLIRHYKIMPRTMLRYAIERFSSQRRHAYLRGEI